MSDPRFTEQTHFTQFNYCFGMATFNYTNCRMLIVSPELVDEHTFQPLQSLTIHGIRQIAELRDFCNDILERFDTNRAEPKSQDKAG